MKLQLTLRDLLWLTVVCALAMGWWVYYRDTRGQLEAAISEHRATTDALVIRLLSHGGYSVEYDQWGRRILQFHGKKDLGPFN